MRTIRLFVSSPTDVEQERRRVEQVATRLNGEFAQIAEFQTIRWETEFYKAHQSFQQQIPEAASCDVVIAIFWSRLGSELPADFPTMPNGAAYPSGSAYEVLTAIRARENASQPDVYVFKKTAEPLISLSDRGKLAAAQAQWERLDAFFHQWFMTPDGRFLAAFQRFGSTDEFEAEVERLLRAWLAEHVLAGRHVVTWPIEVKGSPFCGLDPFETDRASVFFGRSRDVSRAIERLLAAAQRKAPFLLVVGASGVGKSSFVRAGIVPRLIAPGGSGAVDVWRVATMTPGAKPIDALAEAVFGAGPPQGETSGLPEIAVGDCKTWGRLAELMRSGTGAAVDPIVHALTRIGDAERRRSGYDRALAVRLLLVIDQMDDLFAAGSEIERGAFAKLLTALMTTGRVWIIGTLRADLYDQCLAEPDLFAIKRDGADYDLASPGPAELADIVRRPAEAAGLAFETWPQTGETLDERLLREAGSGDVLPLLQFTLQRLFDTRETRNGVIMLTTAAYESFGGLDGAIDRAGEETLGDLAPAEVAALPDVFRQLVSMRQNPDSFGTTRSQLTVRTAALASFGHGSPARRLVDALVAARLLTTSDEEGVPAVRLAHQRVLESWERARRAVQASAAYFRVIGEVRDQMRRWQESGGRAVLLLPRSLLGEAGAISRQFGAFDAATRDFIRVSRWRQWFFRLHLIMLSLPLISALFALGCVAYSAVSKTMFGIETNAAAAYAIVSAFGVLIFIWPMLVLIVFSLYGQLRQNLVKRWIVPPALADQRGQAFRAVAGWRLGLFRLNITILLLLTIAVAAFFGLAVIDNQLAGIRLFSTQTDVLLMYVLVKFVAFPLVVAWPIGTIVFWQNYRAWKKRLADETASAPA